MEQSGAFETLICKMEIESTIFHEYIRSHKQRYTDFRKNNACKSLKELYKEKSTWTVVMNKFILPFIVCKMGFIPQNEYYRVDVIGYKTINKDGLNNGGKELQLKPYGWELGMAIEHENDLGKWIDEVIKLTNIACPLRIIIGYNTFVRGKDSGRIENERISYLFKCTQAMKEQLGVEFIDSPIIILFGQRDDKGLWSSIRYNAYVVNLYNETGKLCSTCGE